jgi:acetyltransferase-like isoleucine patch superfamily enzyme
LLKAATLRQWFFVRQRLFAIASFLLPDSMGGGRIRAALLRWNGAVVGRRCFVRGGLVVQESFDFTIGDDVFVNAGCTFDGAAPIVIENGAQLGFQVTLITGDHEIGEPRSRAGAHCARPIRIGLGAWIGARAVILPGVTIGRGAVVAAAAVVTRDVAPDTLVAGVPARVLRELPGDTAEADAIPSAPAETSELQPSQDAVT